MAPDAEQPSIEDVVFAGAVALAVAPPVIEPIASPAELPVTASGDRVESPQQGDDDQAGRSTRGRRGGRRRKRPEAGNEDAAPPVAPAYTGPTPADPFGNHVLDIFDVIDAQTEAEPPRDAKPAAPVAVEAAPPSAPAPAAVTPIAPPPAPAAAAGPTREEPEAGPVIKPIVIGEAEPGGEKKRGWWRRP